MSTAKDSRQPEIWLADAANIDASSFDLESYVALTAQISEFIDTNKSVVSAPKGHGKTLLLKFKRLTNAEHFREQDPLVIPSNAEIDSFDNAIPFDAHFIDFLSRQVEWEILWQVAIGHSIILNFAIKNKDLDLLEEFRDRLSEKNSKLSNLISLTDKIIKRLREKQPVSAHLKVQANPSSTLSFLLASSLSDLRSSLPHALDVIHQLCLAVDRPVFVYIDQIDQGVNDFPLTLWRNAQNGVVGAIFKLHNPNKHIKIYSSIRSEAWEACEGEMHAQYRDYVTELEYEQEDLRSIFEHAVRQYERAKPNRSAEQFKDNPIRAFIGLDSVENRWGKIREDVFLYMLRHSLRRPRDLILLGGELHKLYKNNRLSEDEFRGLVNSTPAEEISKQYIAETLRFSESLRDVNLQRFFSHVHKNVFTVDELIDICGRYNSHVECNARDRSLHHIQICARCKAANHIFCDLYRIGLLGIVKHDETKPNGAKVQYFKTPGRIKAEHLPSSSFYLLHPAMNYYIREIHANSLFSSAKGIVVGHGCGWEAHYDALLLLARIDQLFRTCGISVDSSILVAHRELIENVSNSRNGALIEIEQPQRQVSKLRDLVTSDGMLSATKFVSEIVGVLDKVKGLLPGLS